MQSMSRAFICLLKLCITVLHVVKAAFFYLVALLDAQLILIQNKKKCYRNHY